MLILSMLMYNSKYIMVGVFEGAHKPHAACEEGVLNIKKKEEINQGNFDRDSYLQGNYISMDLQYSTL